MNKMTEEDTELKKIRIARLQAQMQEQYEKQMTDESAVQEQLNQLEQIVKSRLTSEALSRYGNIKAAHPEKTVQLLIILGQLIQTGRINTINDEQLKDILLKLTPQKHEFKINRK